MPMQELVTEHAGARWDAKSRQEDPEHAQPGDDQPPESAARAGAPIAGALKNGVSRDEIREIFMQVAIYAGVPAGVDSFRAAKEVFEKVDAK
jgi:4-carboxymuconolactone decarboxylase